MQKLHRLNWALFALAVASLITFSACSKSDKQSEEPEIVMDDTSDQISQESIILQALGYSVGQDILIGEFTPEERKQIMAGIAIAAEGGEFANIDELRSDALKLLQAKGMEKKNAANKEEADVNKALGAAFFADLDTQQGVMKTESGLRYRVTKNGNDVFATKNSDSVHLHYHGTLIDGTVFDSSVDRGEPISFSLGGVIKGFSEGLKLVGEGGKITLYMPSDIAYGDSPRPGGAIKPGMTLIFEVELLKVNP